MLQSVFHVAIVPEHGVHSTHIALWLFRHNPCTPCRICMVCGVKALISHLTGWRQTAFWQSGGVTCCMGICSSPEERIVVCCICSHTHPSPGVCQCECRMHILYFMDTLRVLGHIIAEGSIWVIAKPLLGLDLQAKLCKAESKSCHSFQLTPGRNKIDWLFSPLSWIFRNRMHEGNPSLNQKPHKKILLK